MSTPTPPVPLEIPPEILRLLESRPGTEELVCGEPGEEQRIGLVMKRTWLARPGGAWELAPDDEAEPVCIDRFPWREVEPPEVSPIAFDDDTAAFRAATDVVVQGDAQTYGSPRGETEVRVSIGSFERRIRVVGDRALEWSGGTARFGDPAPFDTLPVRYDRAYGGFDPVGHQRFPNPALSALAKLRPEWQLEAATDCHYPRNPSGVGFLIQLDEESVADASVPNFEYPDDPLTPERLAVGSPHAWPAGPLPAGLDWIDTGWFPRGAYLGGMRRPRDHAGPIAEIERGWAAPDLFEIPPLLQSDSLRPEFAQAASPGMSFPALPADAPFELENLHPEEPRWRFQLPPERPEAALDVGGPGLTPLVTRLNAVVVRPGRGQLVMVWCADAPCDRSFTRDQGLALRREIRWVRTR